MAHRDHPHAAFLVSVADCFDLEAREEGTKIALRGDVHSLGGDATFAEGLVLDQTARRVWLGLRDRTFEASCDCPTRSRGVFCRHIWALIVRGVSKGYLGGMGAGVLPAMQSLVPPRERPAVPWQEAVGTLRSEPPRPPVRPGEESEFLYYADPVEAERRGLMAVRVATRRRKKNGELGVPQVKGLTRFHLERLRDPVDQRIIELFMGADGEIDSRAFIVRDSFLLNESLAEVALPVLAKSGRFVLWDGQDKSQVPAPCTWDDGEPWTVRYSLSEDKKKHAYYLRGRFERGEERLALAGPEIALAPGILIQKGKIARFRADGDFRWLGYLRKRGPVLVPPDELEPFLTELFKLREPIPVDLPSSLRIKETEVDPQPRLQLSPGEGHLVGKVTFDYGAWVVEPKDPRELLFQSIARGLVVDAKRRRKRRSISSRRCAGRGIRRPTTRSIPGSWRRSSPSSSPAAGGSRANPVATRPPERSGCRSGPTWTGSRWTAGWSTAGNSFPFPSSSGRCGRAKASCAWATARWDCCPRTGSAGMGCSWRPARRRGPNSNSGRTRP